MIVYKDVSKSILSQVSLHFYPELERNIALFFYTKPKRSSMLFAEFGNPRVFVVDKELSVRKIHASIVAWKSPKNKKLFSFVSRVQIITADLQSIVSFRTSIIDYEG